MKITAKRIYSTVTLVAGVVIIYLALSKPQPVADAQTPEAAQANVQSFGQKLAQLQTPRTDSVPAEVHFSSDEVSAEMAQSASEAPASTPANAANSAPASSDTTGGAREIQLKSYQVKLDGDVARGQFVTQVAGKDLYITVAGHLGSQDGYVTFDPTEFKFGDMNVPVSLVNSALQKRLTEQRDQLKLPEGIASLRVENGELVITQK